MEEMPQYEDVTVVSYEPEFTQSEPIWVHPNFEPPIVFDIPDHFIEGGWYGEPFVEPLVYDIPDHLVEPFGYGYGPSFYGSAYTGGFYPNFGYIGNARAPVTMPFSTYAPAVDTARPVSPTAARQPVPAQQPAQQGAAHQPRPDAHPQQ